MRMHSGGVHCHIRKIVTQWRPVLCAVHRAPYTSGLGTHDDMHRIVRIHRKAGQTPHTRIPPTGGIPIGRAHVFPEFTGLKPFLPICQLHLLKSSELLQKIGVIRQIPGFIHQPGGHVFPSFEGRIPCTPAGISAFEISIGAIDHFLHRIGAFFDHAKVGLSAERCGKANT